MRKNSQFFLLIAIALLALCVIGCSSNKQNAENKATPQDNVAELNEMDKDQAIESVVDIVEPEIVEDSADYSAMVERSLVSTGNNYRMKQVIEKARQGQDTTIAYIGGSITEGYNGGAELNYAKQSYQYFADTFGTGGNVKYVNAGMAGTPSSLGLIRLERDVLQYEPDVVFVEFAVNDGSDGKSMVAYESLIRQLWNYEKQPAVVLIFTVTEEGYSAQIQMANIGRYYDLPMISVKDAIMPEIKDGRMTWSDYSDDTVHPDSNGHHLITEFIQHYYTVLDSEDKGSELVELRESYYNNIFHNMKMLDAHNTQATSLGSFIEDSTIQQFPNGWTHFPEAGNESFIVDLAFSSLFIVTKDSTNISTGTIEIMIDGEVAHVINGYNSSGWNNPVTKLLLQEEASAKHRVEIRMAEGSENKPFSILAFGIVE